jgi:hypothetical protein
MTSKQLSSLLRKTPPATVTEAAARPQPEPAAPIVSVPAGSKEVQLHVLVPAHVRKQVDIMGAQEGLSLRTLALRGSREIGIQVSDEEIRGGHKREWQRQ